MRARTRRTHFANPHASKRWLAEMNERSSCFTAAAGLFREIGDETAASRCEKCRAIEIERENQAGMKWWNECTETERSYLLHQAAEKVGLDKASAAECWRLWTAREIAMEPRAASKAEGRT